MNIPKRYKGIICICLSAFFFALMAVFVRLSGDLPTFQKTFFRNFVALFLAVGVLIKKRIPLRLGEKKLLFPLTVRALAGTVGMIGNFYAVDHLLLSDALMLNKMSPFFAIVFSYLILKEKLTPFQLMAVIAAFGGSLLIIKPSFSNVDLLPALAGFAGGLGAGLAYTCVHYLGMHGVKGPVIVAFFSAFSRIARSCASADSGRASEKEAGIPGTLGSLFSMRCASSSSRSIRSRRDRKMETIVFLPKSRMTAARIRKLMRE